MLVHAYTQAHGGRGVWNPKVQKFVDQKWPKSVSPFVNSIFSHFEIRIRRGGGVLAPPPPAGDAKLLSKTLGGGGGTSTHAGLPHNTP